MTPDLRQTASHSRAEFYSRNGTFKQSAKEPATTSDLSQADGSRRFEASEQTAKEPA